MTTKERNINSLIQKGYTMMIDSNYINIESSPIIPVFSKERKWGFINKNGELVIKPQYDSVLDSFVNEKSYARVTYNDLYGLIDINGKFIIEPIYSHIWQPNKNGYITVEKNYKHAVININNEILIDYGVYSWIDGWDDNGLCRVKKGGIKGKWGIIDESLKTILPVEYEDVWNFFQKNRIDTKIIKDGIASQFKFPKKCNNCISEDFSEYNESTGVEALNYCDYYDEESIYDNPYYNENLDMDQQDMEFWDNL